MLWQRLINVLSPKKNREFSVKAEEVARAVLAAKQAEPKLFKQLLKLELALKNDRK